VSGESRPPVLLVGAGKMGGALLSGWLDQDLAPSRIHVQDPAPQPEVAALLARHGIACSAVAEASLKPAVIVLAVKPQITDQVLPGVARLAGKRTVVLSIAAGRSIASLEKHLPAGTAAVRAMPNTPAAIGRGITAAFANEAATPAQRAECESLLAAGGAVVWLDDEADMDAVTALSGSGPAYVFLLTECLAEAGVALGLEPALAERLARVTVSGAGELMRQSPSSPADLRKAVTSPHGTTAAALEVLMGKDGMQALLTRALKKAAKRSKALSS
jgi:pyrroline-5-carboxylate reductase